jgi:hypothetical protein
MPHAIALSQVNDLVDSIFGDDLHAKRVMSLAGATTGVLRAAAVGIHAIGRALALAKGGKAHAKHNVKQVDRLLSNEAIDVWALFDSWVPFVVSDRSEIVVALDWTHFDQDAQSTIHASLVSSHGRTTPLVWMTVEDEARRGQQLQLEQLLLSRLREVLPRTVVRTVVLADRGFSDAARWNGIRELGFEFVIRIKGTTRVCAGDGTERSAQEWIGSGGALRTLKGALITGEHSPVAIFVAAKKTAMKDGWHLVSSLTDATGPEVMKLYSRRFTIEESFRDIKNLRFGMGLSAARVSTTERRDRLLLLSAIAIALLTLLGAAGEATGLDRKFRTNTSRERQYSLFRQGCDYYEFLPGMHEDWALPLITKFAALLAQHRVFTETLGII